MNHKKVETINLRNIIKNIFFIRHDPHHVPLAPEIHIVENEDHDYTDYISYYQQATRWK